MSVTTEMDEAACPACRRRTDAATSVCGDHRPAPGDVTVCIGCATLLVFGQDLRPRWPTEEERDKMQGDPRIRRVVEAVICAGVADVGAA